MRRPISAQTEGGTQHGLGKGVVEAEGAGVGDEQRCDGLVYGAILSGR